MIDIGMINTTRARKVNKKLHRKRVNRGGLLTKTAQKRTIGASMYKH